MRRFWIILGLLVFVVAGWLAALGWPTLAAPPQQTGAAVSVGQVVASGFSLPVHVTNAGDGSGRLFVVEQGGRIKIIKNGAVSTFLDISSLVSCCGERGLLSVAFDPSYKQNGHFYVDYTNTAGNTVIARYLVSSNPNVANAASAVTLLTIAQPYANHNGGQLMFGPDGYLYIGMGDGGSGGDPENRAQNLNTLLGKILRIDVNHGTPYAIPPNNPYVGKTGRDEIWAYGLRNPWRFSFDRLTGDLYIGDVGQNLWEEIDYEAAGSPGGLNFGWRCKEGTHDYNLSGNPCTGLTGPIAEYSHSVGHSVSGGFVYRGGEFPALVGRYFFADYVDKKIWSMVKTGSVWSTPTLEIANTGFNISSFGEDEQGELYVVDYSGGTIRRLTDANATGPNLTGSTKTSSTPHADINEVFTYTIAIKNTGSQPNQPLYWRDVLPAGLGYIPGSLTATTGTINETAAPQLSWQGTTAVAAVTITYQVKPTGLVTGSLVNRATLTSAVTAPLTLSHAVFVPRPVVTSTLSDFFVPGTQPNQLNAAIADPNGCDFCHTDPIYNSWRGSLMSQAGRDPLFWSALAVANHDAPQAGDFCLRCHTAKGWLEGRSQPADGSSLQLADISGGVTCAVCHRLVDPVPSTTDAAVVIDAGIRAALTATLPATHTGSAMLIVDPEDRRRGPFVVTQTYHSAYQTDFLGQANNAITESRLCGSCHNIDNPLLSWDAGRGQFWPNSMDAAAPGFDSGQLFPIESTYDEWLNSDFAAGGVTLPKFAGAKPGGQVASCQDCHLPRTTGLAAEAVYNPVQRDCVSTGCLPEHQLVGGNTWIPQLLQDSRWRLNSVADAVALNNTAQAARSMLQKAATVTITLTANGPDSATAVVRVINDTGHKLPTGYAEGRRMWLNLKAFDAAGSLIYQSGVYNAATGQLASDPDLKVYEVQQGITPQLAQALQLEAGASFHFVLNNTTVKDNRLPPRGYTQAKFNAPGLRPVAATYADGQYWDDTTYTLPPQTARVSAVLYYQTASKDYVDFLRANGGVDGVSLGQLWDTSKSPPVVMAAAFANPLTYYLPVIFK